MKYLFLLLLPIGAKAQDTIRSSGDLLYMKSYTNIWDREPKYDTCLTEIFILKDGRVVQDKVYQVNKITYGTIPCPDATINYSCAAVHYGEIKSIIGYLDRNKKPLKPVQVWH